MPQQQELLANLLTEKFGVGSFAKPSYFTFSSSSLHSEIDRVYRLLGGKLSEYPTAFRGYDIQLNNCIVELDEEQHFNRYRKLTLTSAIYQKIDSFSITDYRTFCEKHEINCLKKADNRKYWSTSSTDKQFGESSDRGVLDENGSSRWKQRAFYDYLRDAGSEFSKHKLIRIAVHQLIRDKTVDEILKKGLSQYYNDLIAIIKERG